MLVREGEVVNDAALACVHLGAAELLGRDNLARRRAHERRAAEEDGARAAHDDRLVAHSRHVRSARSARAHHDGDLRDASRGHARLIEERAAKVLAVGEDIRLHRQERAARVDEVHARQPVLGRNLLRAQFLFNGHGEVRAALDGRVIGYDDARRARDDADAGHDARRLHRAAGALVHAVRRER